MSFAQGLRKPNRSAQHPMRQTVRNRSVRSVASTLLSLLFALLCLAGWSRAADSDQVVLKFISDPQISTTVVRLKDVVEIVSGSSPSFDKLKEMALGPAPRDGQVQTWHSSDVMQHLELRGVNPKSIRWSGSSKTKLQGVKSITPSLQESITPAFLDESIIVHAKNNVSAAIREYLNLKSRSQVDWRIDPQISTQYCKLLQSRRNITSIGGGTEPWTGDQEFIFQIKMNGQVVSATIKAKVDTPPMIVVATGPIRRDQIITSEMLTYAPMPNGVEEKGYFSEVKEIVGKQLRRSMSTNQALTRDVIGEPIVIQRNELVEVEAVSGSVVVKTSGKSLGSGAVGDLIDIEMQDRKRLKATIVGTSVVRISATSAVTQSR